MDLSDTYPPYCMKPSHKIALIVSAEVLLILASFLVIIHYESQTNLAGNTVNIAGKNRFLAGAVQIELNNVLYRGVQKHGDIHTALVDLENNIVLLKDGGPANGVKIPPLSAEFAGKWENVSDAFVAYRNAVSLTLEEGDGHLGTVVVAGTRLVDLSDVLTGDLAADIEKSSTRLIHLQIAMGVVNVTIHVLMIMLIWRIFSRHTDEILKASKLAVIGELAAAVAHDMRNPLGAIRNSVALIQESEDPKTVLQETERIKRSVWRMSHQVDGVMAHARSVPLVLRPATVMGVMRECLDTVFIPENIQLCLPSDDLVINCDAEKMGFVFANLLLNATQAIGDAPGTITMWLHKDTDHAMISFENSGPPIKGDTDRVFEPLYTTKMEGTGLGLTGCANIVRLHGGTIKASNDPVTFTIYLPPHDM